MCTGVVSDEPAFDLYPAGVFCVDHENYQGNFHGWFLR
jgi:hypothetical protein